MKRICTFLFALLLCLLPLAFIACGSGSIDNPAALAEALAGNPDMFSTEIYALDDSLITSTFGVTATYTKAYGYATAGERRPRKSPSLPPQTKKGQKSSSPNCKPTRPSSASFMQIRGRSVPSH